jgi:hypothetical protein
MTNFDFVTDARLSRAVYNSNNRNDKAAIDVWRLIQDRLIKPGSLASLFGAQLHKKIRHSHVMIRGSEGDLDEWIQTLDMNMWLPNIHNGF